MEEETKKYVLPEGAQRVTYQNLVDMVSACRWSSQVLKELLDAIEGTPLEIYLDKTPNELILCCNGVTETFSASGNQVFLTMLLPFIAAVAGKVDSEPTAIEKLDQRVAQLEERISDLEKSERSREGDGWDESGSSSVVE